MKTDKVAYIALAFLVVGFCSGVVLMLTLNLKDIIK